MGIGCATSLGFGCARDGVPVTTFGQGGNLQGVGGPFTVAELDYFAAPFSKQLIASSSATRDPTYGCQPISPPAQMDVGVLTTQILSVVPPLTVQ
jgi:hypothetical protein